METVANFLISLIARGARFLNWTPWTYGLHRADQSSVLNAQRGTFRVDFIKLIVYVCMCIGEDVFCSWPISLGELCNLPPLPNFFHVGLNILACVGGWCIRGQRRRRWQSETSCRLSSSAWAWWRACLWPLLRYLAMAKWKSSR